MSASCDHECLLIGSGATGMTAAVWLDDYGVPFEWVSRESGVGGILKQAHNPIVDYPGIRADSGSDLRETFEQYLDELGIGFPKKRKIDKITRRKKHWRVEYKNRGPVESQTIILATGTRKRRLGIPGEDEALGTVASLSVSRDKDKVAGKEVAVVGGGDAGFEGALILADLGCRVHMLLRSPEFKARKRFVKSAQTEKRIEFHPFPTIVEKIEKLDENECRLTIREDEKRANLDVAHLFIRIGVDPQYPSIRPEPRKDEQNFIEVDRRCRTSEPGLIASGDVTDTPLRAVCTSTGDGAIAANTVACELNYIGK